MSILEGLEAASVTDVANAAREFWEAAMTDILIVDDNVAFRKTLKHIILSRFASCRVSEAEDGQSAFRKTGEESPALIFMDLRLPGENGLQLTKRIKASFPHVTVVMLTNLDGPEYREAAAESGADCFLSKKTSSASEVLKSVEAVCTQPGDSLPRGKNRNGKPP